MENSPRAPDKFGARLGVGHGLRVDARVVGSTGGARLVIGAKGSIVGNRVDRVDISRHINVVGSGDGIGQDGGSNVKDSQVDVNVAVGHVLRVGVAIRVGNILECRPSIEEVFCVDIEECLGLVGGNLVKSSKTQS